MSMGTEVQEQGIEQLAPASKGRRLSSIWFWLLLVPCVIASNRLAVWLSKGLTIEKDGKPKTPAPKLPVTVVPETLDFGIVWETDALRHDVVFHNVSNQPSVIRNITGTCKCTQVEEEDVRIKPGERVAITLVTDVRELRSHDENDVRPVEIGFRAMFQQGDNFTEGRWVLRGRVRRYLHCEPLRMSLGEELTCGESGRVLKFRIQPKIPIAELKLKRVPTGWEAELVEKERPSNYLLLVTSQKLEPGPFEDDFELVAITEGGRRLPVQRVRVQGRVTPSVEVLPRNLDLGQLSVGNRARATFWVCTKKHDPIEAVKFIPGDPRTKVVKVQKDGSKWRVELERTIDALGYGESSGKIVTTPHYGQEKGSSIRFRWYGTEAGK